MKIVHICISERYIENSSYQENLLASLHVQLGHEVFIIAADRYTDKNRIIQRRSPGRYVNKDGVIVVILRPHISFKFSWVIWGTTKGLYMELSDINPDIIMVHGVTAFENKVIAKYVSRHNDVRLYVDNHNDYYNKPYKNLKQKFFSFIDSINARKLLSMSKMFWGTTPWRVEYLQDVYRIPAEKTGLLIMGADERFIIGKDRKKIRDEVRHLYEIPNNAFLVVTGGTLDKRKQQDLLFDAVKELESQNVWLLAFGSPTKEMEPVFENYKEVHNIVMTGWLPAERAYDLFMASDLAFFPGTHSVLWEQAVACSTPLVVRHWSGMEHVNVNSNAILLDNVTVSTIKDTIVKLNNTPKYKQMVNSAKKVASQFFLTEIAKRAIGQL